MPVEVVSPKKLRDTPVIKNLSRDLEEVIGSNLISKIGMVAILIGMGIGIKYAIDHDLISPLVRILMGYLVGGVLLFFSYRLRGKYTAFGAVLFSGALALLFFTSYAAHIYYALLSQGVSFGIMVGLTIYGVVEALRFNQPVVAHFGLVGAYAIPFLLGDDPDKITFLFTYISIVNLGILSIAFWRYWKSLYYAAFAFTWLIYASWYVFDYRESVHFGPAFVFLVLFFLIFYLAFLAYKLIKRENYNASDVAMLLFNSFIFYGLGYLILQDHKTGSQQLGLFTGLNALLHLGISAIVYRFRLADRNLFYLVSGVGLIFTIITIPVQLDGNWVTFLWAGEAALLFWIGRARKTPAFEMLSYVLFALAFFSLLDDWGVYLYEGEPEIHPVFNIYLLTSLWTAGCFGFSMWIDRNLRYESPFKKDSLARQLLDYSLPGIFILILYLGFQLEIAHYFDQKGDLSSAGNDLALFREIWIVNYSLFFLMALSLVNIHRLRNQTLGMINLGLNVLFLLTFLVMTLGQLIALNATYLSPPEGHISGIWHLLIRYVTYFFVGGVLWTTYRYQRQSFVEVKLGVPFNLLLHIVLLSVASVELYCWMKVLNIFDSFQGVLSILWGVYALMLIVTGIRRSRKHLRIAAIVLIAITLVKVTLIDLADLSTLSKTVVLVILGALLLVISFLYNKFRDILFGEE
ncbi:MAG: DUF2339 domain-containing protein [Lewinellaceae bacterium]|nr:DUF2339 domain-containing protein [Lewinellaceae bacterium]